MLCHRIIRRTPLALTPGTRLGPYEVTALLGEGGMGQVYRARDTKLNRDVALKVLPESFANDPDRLARFQREAQVLASLNHQNIAHIHGLEESGDVRALVMELVEGEDLAQRLARGAIPIDEALPIAKQIAEALEAAHEQGIIHRDLKPGNIKVTPDGRVKVLDFGLAKAMDPPPSSPGVSQSPTITTPAMTQAGMILGTAAYMSPEQAKGRPADKRSDVWAFGCVLYEMLTGKRAFSGEDLTDTIAAVVRAEPDWSALPSDVPAQIRLLIKRCLEKDRRARVGDVSTARFLMSEIIAPAHSLEVSATGPEPRSHTSRLVWATAVLLGGAAILVLAGWALLRRAPSPPVQPARLSIATPPAMPLAVQGNDRDIAISPDGTRIVYRAGGSSPQLVVRAIDQLDVTPIAGTANARAPFISPDGRWVGFFVATASTTELKKVSLAGGPVIPLCKASGNPRGASWGDDDTIVFATADPATGLMSVPAGGGEVKVLTKPDAPRDHVRPFMLPGSNSVLFTISADGLGNISTQGQITSAQIAILDRMNAEYRTIIQGGSDPEYVASGHLVYAVANGLRAVRFDLTRLQVLSDPTTLVEQVAVASGAANFAVSRGGTFVYVVGDGAAAGIATPRNLVWVNRHGSEEPIDGPPRAYTYPRISPDGARVALDVRDRNNDIWIWDIARRTLTPLTFDPTPDVMPVWAQDGGHIAFSSGRNGQSNLFWQAADGTGSAERLIPSANQQVPTSLSFDGRSLVFEEILPRGDYDVGLLTLGDTLKAEPLISSGFSERNAEISPDGRWLAYESNESGPYEVYVRPFPKVDSGRWPVSTGGGTRPLWARNGKELFYLDGDLKLTSVPVQTGSTFSLGKPTKMLNTAYWSVLNGRTYDASPDGQRFLMIKDAAATQPPAVTPASLVVVINWFEELKAIMPAK
jgi:serine/threonine protein kinase/Tol biopolymer transport system component